MWLNIRGVGNYQVSDRGEIRHKKFLKILKSSVSAQGYARVGMRMEGKATPMLVHRLVALAFLDNPENLPHVVHLDGDRLNNTVDNLAWRAKGKAPKKIVKKDDEWSGSVGSGHRVDQGTPYF